MRLEWFVQMLLWQKLAVFRMTVISCLHILVALVECCVSWLSLLKCPLHQMRCILYARVSSWSHMFEHSIRMEFIRATFKKTYKNIQILFERSEHYSNVHFVEKWIRITFVHLLLVALPTIKIGGLRTQRDLFNKSPSPHYVCGESEIESSNASRTNHAAFCCCW